MKKKLYKDKQNSKFCGVCAGLAIYFDVDVTLVRLVWTLFALVAGCGILAYILAAIIMPDAPV